MPGHSLAVDGGATGSTSGKSRELIKRKLAKFDRGDGFLDLSHCGIDDHAIVRVVNQLKSIDGLQGLSLANNKISKVGAVAVAEGLRGLTSLSISNNPIGDAGAAAIAKSLTNLQTLDIFHCAIGDAGAIAIGEQLTRLTKLNCGYNLIRDVGAVAIAQHLTALTKLDIGGNSVSDIGAIAFAKNLGCLTRLRIGQNLVGEEGVVAIAHKLTTLTTLEIGDSAIGDVGAVAIAEHLTSLFSLDVSGCSISKVGAVAIADHLTALKTLRVWRNSITDVGAVAISQQLTNITTLNIGSNKITDVGTLAIAKHLTKLTKLILSVNSIGDPGVFAITQYLTALTTLQLSSNLVRDAGSVVSLLQKLVHTKGSAGLRYIDFSLNPLRWDGSDAPISEETLKQKDPTRLRKLLLRSRPGVAENLTAARATLAGLGMSGKTRLSRWLVDHPKKAEAIDPQDRTIGIELLETKLSAWQSTQPGCGDIMLTLVDCGGQQEQLQSHHNLVYRVSGRSLFILCLHAGKDFRSRDGNRGDYYLQMLQSCHAYGDRPLPVLIVVTHGELTGPSRRKLLLPTHDEFLNKYPQLKIVVVDPYLGHEGIDIRKVRRAVVEFLADMPEIRAKLPEGILKLRDAIKKHFQLDQASPTDPRDLRITNPSISPEEFSEICVDNGIREISLHGDYLRHLANLGIVIAPGVENTVGADVKQLASVVSEIFNPRYINQYVYGLLMNNRLRHQMGFMTEEQLRDETTRLTDVKRTALVKLLKKYLVVFEWNHKESEGLLIPDLLPERTTPATWDDGICGANLHFRDIFLSEPHFFEFLSQHKGVIEPLELSAIERQMTIRPIGVFRDEVCLRRDPCEALVRIDVIRSRIEVVVRGGTMLEAGRFREQLIGSLTPHDQANLSFSMESGAVVIKRWPDDPKATLNSRNVTGSSKFNLDELQMRLERFVKHHAFPWPQKMLALYFRCPHSSLSVIIKKSRMLRAARDEQKVLRANTGRKFQSIEGAVKNNAQYFKAHDALEEAVLQEEYESITDLSREQILSELCSYAPAGRMNQEARKLVAGETTEFLRNTLARQRFNTRKM